MPKNLSHVDRNDELQFDVDVADRFFVAVPQDRLPPQTQQVGFQRLRYNLSCVAINDDFTEGTRKASDKTSETVLAVQRAASVRTLPHRIITARIVGFAPTLHFVHATVRHAKRRTKVRFVALLESGKSMVEVARWHEPVGKHGSTHMMHHFCGLPAGLPFPAAVFRYSRDGDLHLVTVQDVSDEYRFTLWALSEDSMVKILEVPGAIPQPKF